MNEKLPGQLRSIFGRMKHWGLTPEQSNLIYAVGDKLIEADRHELVGDHRLRNNLHEFLRRLQIEFFPFCPESFVPITTAFELVLGKAEVEQQYKAIVKDLNPKPNYPELSEEERRIQGELQLTELEKLSPGAAADVRYYEATGKTRKSPSLLQNTERPNLLIEELAELGYSTNTPQKQATWFDPLRETFKGE